MTNAFQRDANGQAILKGTDWTPQDNTPTTPNLSPIASATSPIALVWPPNAVGLIVSPLTKDAQLADASDTYRFTLGAGVDFAIPGKEGNVTKILRPSATVVEFMFEILK
jgi:hypothetical protein